MADNTYTTTLPSEFVALPELQFLYLDNTNFTGVNLTLDFVPKMASIFELWMDFTITKGGIPTEIGRATTLTSFSATFTGLTGTIPTEMGNLRLMDRLWLYENKLTGTVEKSKVFYVIFLSTVQNLTCLSP